MYLVGPGNSLGVSVALPSFTFPLRFRHCFHYVSLAFPSRFRCVSVRVSAALLLGKRLPGGNDPKNSPSMAVLLGAGGRADPKPKLFWHSGSDLVLYYAVSGSIPGVDVFWRVLQYSASSAESGPQMRRGPKGRTDPNVFQRFRGGI